MRQRIEIAPGDHLETLRRCNGYYTCPKGLDGHRIGPLVGYAGKYVGPDGKTKLQYVGDVYANFVKAEPHSNVLMHFGRCLGEKLSELPGFEMQDLVFCGAPIGGYDLARTLAFHFDVDAIKAEKKVTEAETPSSKEKAELRFSRHNVEEGDRVVVAEDVCNNFSTTHELVGNILLAKAKVMAIVCFLNRSLTVDSVYNPGEFRLANGQVMETEKLEIPVVSLVRLPIDEWRQDDPAVAEDVAKNNVVWSAKVGWDRLMAAMQAAACQKSGENVTVVTESKQPKDRREGN